MTMNEATRLSPMRAGEIMEAVIARGDIANLTPKQRGQYYIRVCESLGLNPMTRPFEFITLNGKLTLYARKDATDQLRSMHSVSVTELTSGERDGVFVVTAKVRNGDGRTDIATGAVSIAGLKGENAANAMMKAETKAKRRATLSICGLGFLDETEIDDVPVVKPPPREKPVTHVAPDPSEMRHVTMTGGKPAPVAPDPDVALVESGLDDGRTETWGEPEGDGIPDSLRRPSALGIIVADIKGLGDMHACFEFGKTFEERIKPLTPADRKQAAQAYIDRQTELNRDRD